MGKFFDILGAHPKGLKVALPVVVQKVVKLNLNGEKLMDERELSLLVSSRSTFNLKLNTIY